MKKERIFCEKERRMRCKHKGKKGRRKRHERKRKKKRCSWRWLVLLIPKFVQSEVISLKSSQSLLLLFLFSFLLSSIMSFSFYLWKILSCLFSLVGEQLRLVARPQSDRKIISFYCFIWYSFYFPLFVLNTTDRRKIMILTREREEEKEELILWKETNDVWSHCNWNWQGNCVWYQ